MRRTHTLLVTLALCALFGGCTAGSVNPSSNGNTPAGVGGGGNTNGAGSREGIGPNDTGIGGTSEGNANSAVKGNSNVEPTGVNKNAGRDGGGAPTNGNKP